LDAKLESALRQSESAIGDAGFSDQVMSGLPMRRLSRRAIRRWTLGGAAAAGSVLTSVLGAPLETVFSSFVLSGGLNLTALAMILFAVVILVPVAWVMYSR
jgi:hypothetical protein